MARPYSQDLRERAVARVAGGESRRSVADAFDVSPSAVIKWCQRLEETGSVAPAQMGGWKPVLLEPHRDFIKARFAEEPELSLRRLQSELAERGVCVCYGTVHSFVRDQGLSFKKNRHGQRAGPSRRGAAAGAVEKASGQG